MNPRAKTALRWVNLSGAVLLALIAGVYAYVATGGMSARREPTAVERAIGQALVRLGIGRGAHDRKNPASERADSADVAAGRELYEAHCAVCHGADGRGTTPAGAGLYPRAADLSGEALAARKRTDGDLFYLVRNGIRNTGMPAWNLSDTEIWDVVAYVRNLPPTNSQTAPLPRSSSAYVGSAACKPCHADIYD